MINLKLIKHLLHSTLNRVFLIIYPPVGEKSILQIDIRIGLIIENNLESLYVIGTDLDDLWSPMINVEKIPDIFFSNLDFLERTRLWMTKELNNDITLEYYDFTISEYFKDIVGKKINDIELVSIEGNPDPFGIKLLFQNDFILSSPNSDGNTIETKTFNKNKNIENFKHLGNIVYSKFKGINE